MGLLENLPHRVAIGRVTRSNDALGGSIYGIILERSSVQCWQQQASASEIRDFAKRGIAVTTKFFFTTNYNLTERHRLLVVEREGEETANTDISDVSNPDTYDVVSVTEPDASAGLGILWKVMAKSKSSDTQ